MPQLVIDLRQFMHLMPGEAWYKGYFIPGKPGWARAMVSKTRTDGLIHSENFVVFLDNEGSLLWDKPVLKKIQSPEDFERDLEEFKRLIQGAGLLFFMEDFREETGGE